MSYRLHSKKSAITTAGYIRTEDKLVLHIRITGFDAIKMEIKQLDQLDTSFVNLVRTFIGLVGISTHLFDVAHF